jgi:hypothetical protein
MQQNLLNAEFVSGEYLTSGDKNMHVLRVIKALTKELLKSFCCIYACRQLYIFGLSSKYIDALINLPVCNGHYDRSYQKGALKW